MSVTTKERDYWNDRISTKIKEFSDQLVLRFEPQFRERIEKEAMQTVFKSLGLEKQFRSLEANQRKQSEAKREFEKLKTIHCQEESDLYIDIGKKMDLPDECFNFTFQLVNAVKAKIKAIVDLTSLELMNQHPLGQQLLELEAERQAVTDLMWLATSSKQIKELWFKLNNSLDEIESKQNCETPVTAE